jgi:hypothetical protein
MKILSVTIPRHENKFVISKRSKKSGKPRRWTVNGQGLYNATMHYTVRSRVTKYFHTYLSGYIKTQISKKNVEELNLMVYKGSQTKLAISLDIYEIRKHKMPDIGNMWIWIKWFEDALQETGIIPDDNPDYVIESGRKRYHFVDNENERKLVFHISLTQ